MKKIEKRGRTLDAVINPKDYEPFSRISNQIEFEKKWIENPGYIMANFAHAAYCGEKYVKSLIKKFGGEAFFYKSKPDRNGVIRGRQAFLSVWDNRAILAFRGTEPGDSIKIKINKLFHSIAEFFRIKLPGKIDIPFLPADIIDDLDFAPIVHKKNNKQTHLHGGFFKATRELWPDIYSDLNKLNLSNSSELYVTGHSLGGAMAVVAGILHKFKVIVTFGQPAVGMNIESTLDPESVYLRYVNGNDPVSVIVPEVIFKHHGKLLKITDIDGPDMLYDHSIINYCEILADNKF